MTIDTDDDLDSLSAVGEMTVQEIYQQLLIAEELILTTTTEVHDELRTALANVKNKENTKLKNENMPVDNRRLVFQELTKRVETPVGHIRFQISLSRRKSFAIHKIELPDDSM